MIVHIKDREGIVFGVSFVATVVGGRTGAGHVLDDGNGIGRTGIGKGGQPDHASWPVLGIRA